MELILASVFEERFGMELFMTGVFEERFICFFIDLVKITGAIVIDVTGDYTAS